MGVTDDLVVLAKLAAVAGAAMLPSDIHALWKTIAGRSSGARHDDVFANLPETGLLLDATPWAALPFVEGETLHYKPALAVKPASRIRLFPMATSLSSKRVPQEDVADAFRGRNYGVAATRSTC